MYRLERACQLQVTTLACNTELQYASDDAVRHTNEMLGPTGSRRRGLREWPALLRRLDRIDPSFRD
jgi:hypothetical protein